MLNKETQSKEKVFQFTYELGKTPPFQRNYFIISGTTTPVDKALIIKYSKEIDGIAAEFKLSDCEKIVLIRQTDIFISDAEWPIIKAKYKDGLLDILVSSPNKTDDRLWILTHNQPRMLKVAYA